MVDLPIWIDLELWDEWMAIRLKKKAVNSPRAIKAIVKKLEKITTEGGDPNEEIERSVINGWKDVYPRPTRGNSLTAAARAFEGSIH